MKRALLIVTLLAALPAAAEVSPDVRKYVGSAAALFEKLEYEKALAQLKRAKAKSQGPEDDLRIALYEGIVLAEMGDSTAPSAFASALGMDPNVTLPLVVSPKVQKVFDKAKAQVQKVIEAEAAAERARAEEKRKLEEANKPPPPAVVEKKEEPPPVIVEKPRPAPTRNILFVPVAAAGVVGVGVGAVLLIQANAAKSALANNVPMNRDEALATANRGANMQIAGWVLVGAGSAVAVAGAALFLFGPKTQASASVMVTPDGAYASLSVPLP
jgi:hypothetical protein